MTCNVTFQQGDQKIILTFVEKDGELDYTAKFDPQIDGKTDLSLSGFLCDVFVKALHNYNGQDSEN